MKGKLGKVHDGSEVAEWERWENSEVARLERWDGSEVVSWERWESSEVARWEAPGFTQGWLTRVESKISFFCF